MFFYKYVPTYTPPTFSSPRRPATILYIKIKADETVIKIP